MIKKAKTNNEISLISGAKKDILIIAQYLRLESEGGNSRFSYIANLLGDNNVEIVTSKFIHGAKSHRSFHSINENNCKVTMVDEPGYHKNVTPKRFYSHYKLAKNLKKYLKTRKKPDLIYCAVPSLDVGVVAANYSKKHKVPFIVDIQDLWPDAFKMAFSIPILSDLVFLPFNIMAKKIYRNANEIVAVSQTYVNKGLSVNKQGAKGLSVFLGTNLQEFDKYLSVKPNVEKKEGEIWLAYIGTLGTSYNIKLIIDALAILKEKGVNNIKFVVIGLGPLKESLELYAKEKDINCQFAGRLPYQEMASMLSICDIAVNPIIDKSVASIINKVGDYAAASLPVINTLKGAEYRNLLESYNAGINCDNDNLEGMVEAILSLSLNEDLRKTMGKNNRKLAEDKFDREKTYASIVSLIENWQD